MFLRLIPRTEVTKDHNGATAPLCELCVLCVRFPDLRLRQRVLRLARARFGGHRPPLQDWSALFLASGSGAFFSERGAGLFGEMGDGPFLFRGGGGFLDVAAGGGGLFGSRHRLLTFLFLSGGGGFLGGAGAIGFSAFAGGGVSLPR